MQENREVVVESEHNPPQRIALSSFLSQKIILARQHVRSYMCRLDHSSALPFLDKEVAGLEIIGVAHMLQHVFPYDGSGQDP